MNGFEHWKADVALGVAGNLAFTILGAAAVLLLAWLRTFLFGGRRQLALMLGASALNPGVEIIVSNLFLDGSAGARARGSGSIEQGYIGATVSQPEIEAAIAIRDRLTRTELPFVDEWGSRRLSGVKVRIRPSDHRLHAEAGAGFQETNRIYRRPPRAIVVIGSPAYNRACYEILGPTVDDKDGVQAAESDWPSTLESSLLLGASRFLWVRRSLADVTTPTKKLGARIFQLKESSLEDIRGRHPRPDHPQP